MRNEFQSAEFQALPLRVRARWLALLVLFSLVTSRAAGATPDPAEASAVGRRLPSERSVTTDPETGAELVFLTNDPAADIKIYQTHPSWTPDGRWIVFSSDRSGSAQIYAVDERDGTIVQLTDEPEIDRGQIVLSRHERGVFTVAGRDIVRIDFGALLDADGDRKTGNPSDSRSVVASLPRGAKLSGTMSLDANEEELYAGLELADRPAAERWEIASVDCATGEWRTVTALGFQVGHVQASPTRSGLLQFCHETGGDAGQRMWRVRSDANGLAPFYRETFGEWVTHEVWQDGERAIFTIWPGPEGSAMRRNPHGIASVNIDGEVTFHSRSPYWHVTAAPGSSTAVADTLAGDILRVDLESGEHDVITRGHRPGATGAHAHPTMHPDGARVLFNSSRNGNADLCVVRVEPFVAATRRLRTLAYRSGQTAEEVTKWQRGVREKLAKLLAIDDLARATIPLDTVELSREKHDGYELIEIELRSTPGRKIRALVTVPGNSDDEKSSRKSPYPAVVCIHGHGGTRRSVHDATSIYKGFAAKLGANGYVTIATDVGQHEIYEEGRTLLGERLHDLRRCVDWLVAREDVDAKRIGCAGLSLGGEMAMWLGAMDERIEATVSAGFLTIMDQMEQNHCMCWKIDGLRDIADFADIYSLTAPRALLFQNGEREPLTQFWVPLAKQAFRDVRRTYVDLAKPDRVELDIHGGAHEIDLPALERFFATYLGSSERGSAPAE